jgi:hypothetical protein
MSSGFSPALLLYLAPVRMPRSARPIYPPRPLCCGRGRAASGAGEGSAGERSSPNQHPDRSERTFATRKDLGQLRAREAGTGSSSRSDLPPTSPVILRERRPTATAVGGEGSGSPTPKGSSEIIFSCPCQRRPGGTTYGIITVRFSSRKNLPRRRTSRHRLPPPLADRLPDRRPSSRNPDRRRTAPRVR